MSAIQSVSRALDVLRCLAGGPAGVSEISDRVGLPKSTVSRMLSTLLDGGAVVQDDAGGLYRLGPLVRELAAGATSEVSLVDAAHPHLAELVTATGEAAGLSVLDGAAVHYLVQVAADTMVQVRDWTGERVPAHVTSSGLVLMAMRKVQPSSPLRRFTDRSVVDPRRVLARLASIRARGVEWTEGEYLDELSSVAAPVFGRDRAAIAAVHVHGPSYRFPGTRSRAEVEDLVMAAADRIARRLAEVGG